MNTADHGEHALAAGWSTRTAELVDEIGEDCVERGWVAFLQMFRALGEGDFAAAQLAGRTRHTPPGAASTTATSSR